MHINESLSQKVNAQRALLVCACDRRSDPLQCLHRGKPAKTTTGDLRTGLLYPAPREAPGKLPRASFSSVAFSCDEAREGYNTPRDQASLLLVAEGDELIRLSFLR